MKERWILKKRSFKDLSERLNISPLLAHVLRGRVSDEEAEEFLDREGPLFDPFTMRDLENAARFLLAKIRGGAKIFIVGDYDVDGVTSASILYKGITGLGGEALIRIPHRVGDGYGMRPYMADEALAKGCSLIITCDNGIREFEAMRHAKDLGIPVILTDHHEITLDEEGKDVLPEAEFILNPHRQDETCGFESLCGAGVAYKFIQGLYRLAGRKMPDELLALAALGTVCDLMVLRGENRRIVYQGLKVINQDPPLGIQALMDAAGIAEVAPYHCGFVLGPMINAGGRLADQQKYISLLLTDSREEAMRLAEELKALNIERQKMTTEGFEEALRIVDQDFAADVVKVVYLPSVNESIAGLIAGKIKEKYYRPTIILGGDEPVLKGSARSIEGFDIFRELQKLDPLLDRYGGHPMAAGLSLSRDNLEALRASLNEQQTLSEEELMPKVLVDAMLPIQNTSIELVEELEALEPYGNGNEQPVFGSTGLKLTRIYIMGKNRNAARLYLIENGRSVEAITFRMEMLESVITEKFGPHIWQRLTAGEMIRKPLPIDLLYTVSINEYRGLRNVQCTVCNLR